MTRHLGLIALAFLLPAFLKLAPGAHASTPELTIEAEESPPESFQVNGQMGGITGELLRRALARAAVSASLSPVPWQRAYDDALSQPMTCAYPTSVTEERLPLFKWVGPLTHNDWVLVGTKEVNIRLDRVEDARRYRIGVYQGDAREAFFKSAGGYQVESVNSNELNLTRLEAGRIDLWAASVYTVWYERGRGFDNLRVVLPFRSVVLSLACNKSVPDDVIARLNQAVAELIANGTAAVIEAPYQ